MKRVITALFIIFISLDSYAGDVECEKLGSLANQSGSFLPAKWGHVTADGKTFLFSAPDKQCNKKSFVIKGNYLSIYTPYKEWLQVMYVNEKTGEDFMGWVLAKNVTIEGQYGP